MKYGHTGPPLPEIKAGYVWNLLKNGKEDSAEEAVDDTVNVISSPWWAVTLLQGMWKIDIFIMSQIWGLSWWYQPGKSSLIIWQEISALPLPKGSEKQQQTPTLVTTVNLEMTSVSTQVMKSARAHTYAQAASSLQCVLKSASPGWCDWRIVLHSGGEEFKTQTVR